MQMLPGNAISYWALTANLTSRGPSRRRMCPSHLYLRLRTAVTMSKVRLYLLASSCALLPVNLDSARAFAPFSLACVSSVMCHASLPYVNVETTAALYTASFRVSDRVALSKTCHSLPHLLIAKAIRLVTS
jgi:hypothetical protein